MLRHTTAIYVILAVATLGLIVAGAVVATSHAAQVIYVLLGICVTGILALLYEMGFHNKRDN